MRTIRPPRHRLPVRRSAAQHTPASLTGRPLVMTETERRRGELDLGQKIKVSLVVPVFNEESTVDAFISEVRKVTDASVPDLDFEFVFVNDGSSDQTLAKLQQHARDNADIVVVDLSRNFGKEAALTAGIDTATGDAVIPMDVDLQDPPDLLPKMIDLWRSGAEVVLCRRASRASDSLLKRLTASAFYQVHNWISDPKIVADVGDFRLMDRMVVEALKRLPESRRFMKGLLAWVGFRTVVLDYTRQTRHAGTSKFSGWKLWNLALEGITSFSTAPLRYWTYLGATVAMAAFVYGAYLTVRTLMHGIDVPGYASLFVAVTFFGGLQLIGIGVLGEYLGRTYLESKQRPVYIVRQITKKARD